MNRGLFFILLMLFLSGCHHPPRGSYPCDTSADTKVTDFPTGRLLAGVASVEITPERQVYIAGFGNNRKSRSVHDELYVRAVVFEQGGERLALLVYDLVGLQRHQMGEFFAAVEAAGVPREHTVIACTHTHHGPDSMGYWGTTLLQDGRDMEYFGRLAEQAGEVVRQAIRDLRPVQMTLGSAHVPDKGVARNIREPEWLDTEVGVIGLYDKGLDRAPYAVLINFAMHPETLWSNNHVITADFPGYTRTRVEELSGASLALFYNGALGGMVTVDNKKDDKGKDLHSFEECERVGYAVADAAIEALENAKPEHAPRVRLARRVFYMPFENSLMGFAAHAGLITRSFCDYQVQTEALALRIGGLTMITLPGEVYPKIGLKLKDAMQTPYKWEIGLANDELIYLIYEEDYRDSEYSYERSVAFTGPRGGQVVEQNLLELLAALDRSGEE